MITHSHSDLVALVDPAITNKTALGRHNGYHRTDGDVARPFVRNFSAVEKIHGGLEGNTKSIWDWNSSADI